MMLIIVMNIANYNSLIFVFQLYLMAFLIILIGLGVVKKISLLRKNKNRKIISITDFLKKNSKRIQLKLLLIITLKIFLLLKEKNYNKLKLKFYKILYHLIQFNKLLMKVLKKFWILKMLNM